MGESYWQQISKELQIKHDDSRRLASGYSDTMHRLFILMVNISSVLESCDGKIMDKIEIEKSFFILMPMFLVGIQLSGKTNFMPVGLCSRLTPADRPPHSPQKPPLSPARGPCRRAFFKRRNKYFAAHL